MIYRSLTILNDAVNLPLALTKIFFEGKVLYKFTIGADGLLRRVTSCFEPPRSGFTLVQFPVKLNLRMPRSSTMK